MQFPVCYLDPPWPYEVWSEDTGHGRSAEAHYDTMSWPDLEAFGNVLMPCLLPGAMVFMWVVPPSLDQALDMARSWELEYITKAFCWVKLTTKGYGFFTGMGHYTRANTEDCLLFWKPGKGNKLPRLSHGIKQVVVTMDDQEIVYPDIFPDTLLSPVARHSRKPSEIGHKIQQLFDGPYLEVFARERNPGRDNWVYVGNEVNFGADARSILPQIAEAPDFHAAAALTMLDLTPTTTRARQLTTPVIQQGLF